MVPIVVMIFFFSEKAANGCPCVELLKEAPDQSHPSFVKFFSSVVSIQDLKEKKLVEDKENGKDAATNGKVSWRQCLQPNRSSSNV